MSFDDVVKVISANEDVVDFLGEMPEMLVGQAEKRLGVKFPKSYREFVRGYGCGNFGSAEFYGVGFNEPNCIPSVIFATESLREIGLPHDLICVADSGSDWQFMIDTSQEKNGESPIIEWIPGAPLDQQSRDIVYSTFEDFFLAWTKEEL